MDDTMFTDILWRLLMLETIVIGTLCCVCPSEHPQTHFCLKDFVVNVEINEKISLLITKAFLVKIKTVFKGDIQELKFIRNHFVILEMKPECPVDSIKTGDTYVIFGDNSKGNIYTMACYRNMPWEKTTPFYRRALEKYYKRNCDCHPISDEITKQNHCKWNYSFMRKSGKHCKWTNTSHFQRCELLNRPSWK